MPKKVLVVYYTQTGQLRKVVDSVCGPLSSDSEISVRYEEIKPRPDFPFPWTSDEFFQAMPESVKGIPCEIEPLNLTGDEDFDLIIVAWQPWYLSPSIPTHAFFQNETAKKIINNKPVVTIIGCRNMWVMAHERVKEYIHKANGHLMGNILLQDKAPNLLSVASVIHWMFHGKQERYLGIFPPSGISGEDISGASKYGQIIDEAIRKGNYNDLRAELVKAGAVDVKTSLAMIEKRGIIMFRLWAGFILRKGGYGNPSRLSRIRIFKYYLLFVIYFVSPFASILYKLLKPFRGRTIKKQIAIYQS